MDCCFLLCGSSHFTRLVHVHHARIVISVTKTDSIAYNEEIVRICTALINEQMANILLQRRLGAADNKIFENSNFTEVYRRMHVHIQVTQVKYQPEHPEHPKLYFVGTMGDFSTSTMSGYVMLTADNQIQWSFVIFIHFQQASLHH